MVVWEVIKLVLQLMRFQLLQQRRISQFVSAHQ